MRTLRRNKIIMFIAERGVMVGGNKNEETKKIPLMKVGPKFNIVSFKTNPKSYCEIFPLASLLTLDPMNLVIPAVRILIAAEAKEETTFQHRIE